ncbi:hemolysin D [Nostoc cf. commune SO-36]|uniref:Hemolysin D n=1 Tax=Nostoc cf. commune SO-36 TaxID=449208 RepID=A0ABN6Q9F4_NOSCO|nr:calcium-binding protein [Nostoc commune]BDI19440.1 hemolysin D [Nostoc cf. commune SO-36]
MANVIGTNSNDTLVGSNDYNDTINGKAGNDTITPNGNGDTVTGGGGKDEFVYSLNNDSSNERYTITDFSGVGKGTNPTAEVIAEVDTIKFKGDILTARNLLLAQNGDDLEITFEGQSDNNKVILQNFALENLDNLSKTTGATVDLGNILFDGQTSITDSFDVFNGNSSQSTIFNKNTVTFLNDLSNNVNGFDNSDDVINGQGGDDVINGLSGNDILRGGAGNDTLNGGAGDDSLTGGNGNDILTGGGGKDMLRGGAGNNTLNGGADNDTLNVDSLIGDNLLSGGDGNDSLFALGYQYYQSYGSQEEEGDLRYLGNNTLNGDAGNDTLNVTGSFGDNLLSGGDGNDSLSVSGYQQGSSDPYSGTSVFDSRSFGNNTLNGGGGDDTLDASGSFGDNLLSGGDGNDSLSVSGLDYRGSDTGYLSSSSGNNTLNGGAGNDTLDASGSLGDNVLSGGDGNDTFYLGLSDGYSNLPSDLVTQTVDGGKGEDVLSVYFNYDFTGAITTTFDAATSIGSITGDKSRVNYKNIERLNISGTGYDDNIVGSDGNDTLSTGNAGNDTVDGGKGDDVLSVGFSYSGTGGITTTFDATTKITSIKAGTEQVSYKNIEQLNISGTRYDDNIVGSDGNDTLFPGIGGKDTVDGGKGDDVLSVGFGDSATGGITTTFDAITSITLITAGKSRFNYKNIERLNISGTGYDDNIVGGDGDDTLSTNNGGKDTVDGGKGDDVLSVRFGYGATRGITTTFDAITSITSITAGKSRVNYKNIERLNISGTRYDDNIVGSDGNDTLSTGSGDDDNRVNGGNDTVDGGKGDDLLSVDYTYANSRMTTTFNATNNIGSIAAGTDQISYKNIERLSILGTQYDDYIVGSNGNDNLYGNNGTDTFAFYTYNQGLDTIYDFDATNELIQVSSAGFDYGLSIGSLSASQFIIGTSAMTSNQRFIYDNTTGALYFDQDGNAGAFAQVQFAQLSNGLSLTENNFVVV